jgi:alkylation response protein AidB-like acyl-CoA dehydrogenase
VILVTMSSHTPNSVAPVPLESVSRARRYATERFQGATGRNWWDVDPSLQFLMRRYVGDAGLRWAEPRLSQLGALIGGPVSERADITDKHPPELRLYDKWGQECSDVIAPASFEESRRDLRELDWDSERFRSDAQRAGVEPRALVAAWWYLITQAEIGMACALTTGEPMVVDLVADYAPEDVKRRVQAIFGDERSLGEAAQMLTERSGGTDLGAMETTATPDGDGWRLNGTKWFVSNAGAPVFVVLAKPVDSADSVAGIAPFLVLRERRDGHPNGVRIRQLKDKLGTKAVASGEVDLVDAEAFLLSPPELAPREGGSVTAGFARIMEMTNSERHHVSMMGLGCARRALVEAYCYVCARESYDRRLIDQPLVRRKLSEMIVEVEAAQAMVFDGFLGPQLRLSAPLAKLRSSRLGITSASDAIEMHGGNGYIETWPVARILRDAQVNTVWEGPDNVLCLDVRRAILREEAHLPFLARVRDAVASAPRASEATAQLVRGQIEELEAAIQEWLQLEGATAEARLFPLAQYMVDIYASAMLLEQAGWEARELGTARKALLARLYVNRHLAPLSRRQEITAPTPDDDEFELLCAGAFDIPAPL